MKSLAVCFALLLLLLPLGTDAALAQNELQPRRLENVAWTGVTLVKFNAGSEGRAMEIIRQYFEPAAQKAGIQAPQIIEMRTGEWNLVLLWPMAEGVEGLTWEVHPDNAKWMQALGEVAGGADKGQALWREYLGLVDEGTYEIGFTRR
jgi:hypothetical protein